MVSGGGARKVRCTEKSEDAEDRMSRIERDRKTGQEGKNKTLRAKGRKEKNIRRQGRGNVCRRMWKNCVVLLS